MGVWSQWRGAVNGLLLLCAAFLEVGQWCGAACSSCVLQLFAAPHSGRRLAVHAVLAAGVQAVVQAVCVCVLTVV